MVGYVFPFPGDPCRTNQLQLPGYKTPLKTELVICFCHRNKEETEVMKFVVPSFQAFIQILSAVVYEHKCDYLVVSTQMKNMLVILHHFPKFGGKIPKILETDLDWIAVLLPGYSFTHFPVTNPCSATPTYHDACEEPSIINMLIFF